MNKRGIALMGLGILLITCALGLLIYNAWDENRANTSVDVLMPKLLEQIEENSANPLNTDEITRGTLDPDSPLTVLADDAAVQMKNLRNHIDQDTLEIDGTEYIGYLSIPGLDLELPIISQWSYAALKIAPGRYMEPNYTHGFIIAGHNYSRHFGRLNTLSVGDPVVFTDIYGTVYPFKVSAIVVLEPDDMEGMVTGDWDLTLFTCTYGGATRVTVRCVYDNKA